MHSQFHNEQQLLAALANSDRHATAEIYNREHKVVSGWIVKHGGEAADASDVFQDAMMVLYQKAQSEDFRLTCKIGTYLFAISKRLWYKRLQQQQKHPGLFTDGDDEENGGGEQGYEDDMNVHHEREVHYSQLEAAMDQLGEPCRSLLKSFYHDDKSMQEIAADFGYTNPDNAKTQKYKCLTRLRKIFYSVQAR